MERLLIISCSKAKKRGEGKVKAWDLYDGPFFRMLKKVERERSQPIQIDILILSAEHGLLKPSAEILFYERRMTLARARELRPEVSKALLAYVKDIKPAEVFIAMGKNYRKALGLTNGDYLNSIPIRYAKGGIGRQLKETKEWVLKERG